MGAVALDGDIQRFRHPGVASTSRKRVEQDVLGADVFVRGRPCLARGEDEHEAGALGESLKHVPENPTPDH